MMWQFMKGEENKKAGEKEVSGKLRSTSGLLATNIIHAPGLRHPYNVILMGPTGDYQHGQCILQRRADPRRLPPDSE